MQQLSALQADSEFTTYQYKATDPYPSTESATIQSVVKGARERSSSSFVVSSTHLARNEAQGAGGAIFATSPNGLYLLCSPSASMNDSGQHHSPLSLANPLSVFAPCHGAWQAVCLTHCSVLCLFLSSCCGQLYLKPVKLGRSHDDSGLLSLENNVLKRVYNR